MLMLLTWGPRFKNSILRSNYGKRVSVEHIRMNIISAFVTKADATANLSGDPRPNTGSSEEVVKSRREQLLVPKEENA